MVRAEVADTAFEFGGAPFRLQLLDVGGEPLVVVKDGASGEVIYEYDHLDAQAMYDAWSRDLTTPRRAARKWLVGQGIVATG